MEWCDGEQPIIFVYANEYEGYEGTNGMKAYRGTKSKKGTKGTKGMMGFKGALRYVAPLESAQDSNTHAKFLILFNGKTRVTNNTN